MGSLEDGDQIDGELRGQIQDVTQEIDYLKVGWEKMTDEYRASHTRFTKIETRLEDLGSRFDSMDRNIQQISQVMSRLEGVYSSEKSQGKAIASSYDPLIQVPIRNLESNRDATR